jgi:chemotaxis protein CheX
MNPVDPPLYRTMVDNLVLATKEVIETMVTREKVTFAVPLEGDALRPKSNVVGTVAFAGGASGLVAFYSTFDTARDITVSMIGTTDAPNGQVIDAIGEITNMIAGSLRTRMSADGSAWAMSIPTVTTGSDFYTACVSDVRRVLCPFRIAEHEVFVELIVSREVATRAA